MQLWSKSLLDHWTAPPPTRQQTKNQAPPSTRLLLLQIRGHPGLACEHTHAPFSHSPSPQQTWPGPVPLCRLLDSPGTPVVELLTSMFSFKLIMCCLFWIDVECSVNFIYFYDFLFYHLFIFFLLHTFWQILLLGDKLKDALNELEKACLSSTTALPFR